MHVSFLTLSQALIAEPQVMTSGSEPWRVLGMPTFFSNACPGGHLLLQAAGRSLSQFLFRVHVRVGTCYCRRPDAALKVGLKGRRLQLHWEWATKASHQIPRSKTSSYRTIPASRHAANCPACQAPANVAAVMPDRIV